jgi:sterol desaturase/sphingolipid hydroxylase (fatty acid hydroxylase superfamily)
VTWLTALTVTIGMWTMYIHCGVPTLCWPFMGPDYHYVHHKYDWYNFGFFTMFWDWVFSTLKHPKASDYEDENKYA